MTNAKSMWRRETHFVHPNRIAPGMKNDLKKEIDELLVLGILVPSKSPWSSPMVPLRKKKNWENTTLY